MLCTHAERMVVVARRVRMRRREHALSTRHDRNGVHEDCARSRNDGRAPRRSFDRTASPVGPAVHRRHLVPLVLLLGARARASTARRGERIAHGRSRTSAPVSLRGDTGGGTSAVAARYVCTRQCPARECGDGSHLKRCRSAGGTARRDALSSRLATAWSTRDRDPRHARDRRCQYRRFRGCTRWHRRDVLDG